MFGRERFLRCGTYLRTSCVIVSFPDRYLSTAQLGLAGDSEHGEHGEHGEQGEAGCVSEAVGRLRQALVRPRRGFHLSFC